jgi:hypothetical protein
VDESGVFPVDIIPPLFSLLISCYITWGMNNRPVGGRSSETTSHPIDMIIIMIRAQRRGRVVKTPTSYSGGPGSILGPCDRLS